MVNNELKTKICNKCQKELDVNLFYKSSSNRDRLMSQCINCTKKQNKIYHQKNKEKIRQRKKEHYLKNKEKIRERDKKYYLKNKAKILQRDKKYYLKNKAKILQRDKKYYQKNKKSIGEREKTYQKKNRDKIVARKKVYYQKNKGKIIENARIYVINRYHNDINYKLRMLLRWRVWSALKGLNKSKSTMELIGCSIDDLKIHLESQFVAGMSWDNQGEWHIDHIQPCNTFDLVIPREQQKCFHYSNLRPLWGKDNISRPKDGSDLTEPDLISFK